MRKILSEWSLRKLFIILMTLIASMLTWSNLAEWLSMRMGAEWFSAQHTIAIALVVILVFVVMDYYRRQKQVGERRFRILGAALESSTLAVVITDELGRIEWVNQQYQRNTGYDISEVKGRLPNILSSGLTPKDTYLSLRTALKLGRNWRGEFVNRRKDGSIFWDEATISVVNDDAGCLIGYVSLQEDITEHKNLVMRLESQLHLNRGIRQFGEALKNKLTPDAVSRAALAEMTRFLAIPYGAIHSYDQAGVLTTEIRFGGDWQHPDLPPCNQVLVKDVIVSAMPLSLKSLPESVSVSLAGGVAGLTEIRILPLGEGLGACGALELGLLKPLSEEEDNFLTQAAKDLAVALKLSLDINVRKLVELKLAEQLHFSQQLFDAIPSPIYFKDTQACYIDCNKAFEAFFGKSREYLRGRTVYDLYDTVDLAASYARSDDELFRTSRMQSFETTAVSADGVHHDVIIYKALFNKSDGSVGGLVGEILDVTERKRIEGQVIKREAYFRDLLEASPDATILVDEGGLITLVNREAEHLFGYQRDEMVGRLVEMLMPARYQHSHVHQRNSFSAEAVRRSLDSSLNLRGLHKDGHEFPIDISLAPLGSEHGRQVVASIRDISARLAQEEKLRLSNFLSDQALDLTKAGYWHIPLDNSGWFNSSERAAAIFGDHPREDWRYRVMEEWFANVEAGDKEYAAATLENFSAAVEGRIPAYDAIYAYKRPLDGRIVWIHALGHVVRDADGHPTDMYGVTQDITDLHEQEQKLYEVMEQQRAIFDNAPSGIIFESVGIIRQLNRGFTEIFGADESALLNHQIAVMFGPPENYIAFIEAMAFTLHQDRAVHTEWTLYRLNEEPFDARISVRTVNVKGFDRATIWVIEDISVRKKMEARLADQIAFQQVLVDTIPYPLFYKGADSCFLGFNASYEKTFNVRQEDVIGKRVLDLTYLPEADRLFYQAEDEEVIRLASHIQREMSIPFADGKIHETLYFVSGFRLRNGAPGGLIGTFVDISTHKEAQRLMAEAKEAADIASQAKGDFLANMSHEIRTPMNAIIGMAHLALRTELSPRQKDYVAKIQQSAQHLLGIINDILDFSKVEAGKLSVEKINMDLLQVLDNVANLIMEKASAKNLEVIFDVSSKVPTKLLGDPLRLGQILINYANNAVKFTDAGEITIIIEKLEEAADQVLLKFSVRDTGVGLSAEQMSRLFQSFSQADASTTRKYGGTGLGLAISKSLAELMDGQVGVDSEVGHGSTFWFTAWLGCVGYADSMFSRSPDLRGKRVLVVDDSDTARDVLSDILSSMGFRVTSVASGVEALDAIRVADVNNESFELVCLDWRMPEMDGIETACHINQLTLACRPHQLMVTSGSRDEFMVNAREAGITDVLTKPVNASSLFDALMRIFGHADVQRHTVGTPSVNVLGIPLLSGVRILLVEDNELNQEVACGLLEETQCIVDIADNGLIATQKIQTAKYDIVLMDMQMPVMDGITATVEIKKLNQYDHIPIVAMTANAMQVDKDRCVAAGMVDFVAKPIDPDELWRVLKKWVKSKSMDIDERVTDAAQADPLACIFDAIVGLDVTLGLKRVLGKKSLYLSMLKKFVAGQKQTASNIQMALDSDDFETAERLAHTLKGVSGNIGASSLQAQAAEMETSLREKQSRAIIDERLRQMAATLEALIVAIVEVLPTEVADGHPMLEVDPVQLQSVLAQLESLLLLDNPEAGDLLQSNTDLLRVGLGDAYRDIDHRIQDFDFDAALVVLRQAMASKK